MGRYTPGNPQIDPKALPRYLQEEQTKIANALDTPNDFLLLRELSAEPLKPRAGMTVLAEGVIWDPGSGQGVYTYYGAAWHKLG